MSVPTYTYTYATLPIPPPTQDGKQVTRGKVKAPAVLESGSILELGGYVAEYDRHVSEEEFRWVGRHRVLLAVLQCCAL